MAMTTGGRRGGAMNEINVTPMIDVLLVLLIIFMVVQQGLQRGLAVQVPPPGDAPTAQRPGPDALVLQLAADGGVRLNRRPLDGARLAEELAAVLQGRARRVLFVQAAEELPYGRVIAAVDQARLAGVDVVGLVPRRNVDS